jgi:ribosomal protein S15P/S13E
MTEGGSADMGAMMKNSSSFQDLGMTRSQGIKEMTDYYKQSKTEDIGERVENLIGVRKSTLLDQQDISSMLELRRYGSQATASGTAAEFQTYLKDTKQSLTVLPEIIQQYTNEVKQNALSTGKTNEQDVVKVMKAFGERGFTGEQLSGAMSKFRAGGEASGNPLLYAFQLQAARQVSGEGASYWDLKKVMANPTDPNYQQNYMKYLKNVTGGGEQYEMALSEAYKLNPLEAERWAKLDLSQSKEDFQSKIYSKEFGGMYLEEGKKKTYEIEKFEATQKDSKEASLATSMDSLVETMNKLVEAFGSEENNISSAGTDIRNLTSSIQQLEKTYKNTR